MNKSKWHAKLLSLAVVFALVVSMVATVVVPAGAQAASPLVVDVSTDNTTYCCSTNFTVTATITVPVGTAATNVSATISWTPGSGLDLLSPSATQTIPVIGSGNSTPVLWEVHCNEPNAVIITVKVTADAPYEGPVSKQWHIEQTSANLFTDVIWPEEDTAVMACTTFNLTFDIINDGCQGATNIRVTVDPGLYTEVVIDEVGQGAGNVYTMPSFPLDSDSSRRFVLDLHCVEVGTDTIHVDIPYAKDGCTGREIQGTSDLVGIIQYERLLVACNVTPQLTKTGYNVTFTADATGGIPPYTWSWDFGDGIGTSTNQNDVYAYPNPGTYYPEVTVTDSWGNNATCNGTVEVRAHPTIISCNATPNPTKIGYNTTFTATAINGIGPYTWAWDFETDGIKDVTGLADPTYVWTYPASGTYNATVYMSDAWVNNATCNVTVEVREHPGIEVCGANYSPTKVGVNTTFTATVVGGVGPYTWVWDFGNGDTAPDVTADPPPSISTVFYTYSVPGTYNVSVNVTDSLDNPASCNFTLEVKDHPAIIACNSTPPETKVNDEVYFDAWVIGGVPDYIFSWDVDGNGSEDFGQTTSGTSSHVGPYTYTISGTYNVSVSLLDKFNNPASCNFTIVVHPALSVNCSAEPDPVLVCHNVTFTATREGGVPGDEYSWLWEFGDGFTSTSQNVTRAYMCVGNYTATVTLTDMDLGNTANCTANVTVIMRAPELYNPELNETVLSRWVTFEWEDVFCCNYTLEVWQKDGAKEKVLLVDTGKDNFWSGWIMDGDMYKWQVTATDSCGLHSATSEHRFFEVQDTYLDVAVVRPEGGETFVKDSQEAIVWETIREDSFASGFGATGDEIITVDLSYSSNGGATWTSIATGNPKDGLYVWTVPGGIDSNNCYVKAEATDGYGNYDVGQSGKFSIVSDATAPTVTVISPNGGESYAGGDSQTIGWTATDAVGVTSINLYFSFDGGVNWPVIATGEDNDGSYSWTVPGVNSDMCLVKAVAFDAAGNSAEDMSDSVFTVATAAPDVNAPVVTVNRPDGGETFAGGSQEFILWSATDDVTAQEDIGILIYYKVGTGSWTEITAFDGVNDGEYKWDVPEINSTQCLIKVVATDEALNTGFDVSNEFAIATEEVVVPVTSYNITLYEGWNLVSLPLIPTSNNITDVLAGISGAGNVTQVWAFDPTLMPGDPWLSYYPWVAWSANELQEMNDGVGYWVVMDGAGTLTVNGQCMPDPGELPPMYGVYSGWNMIGMKSITTRDHDDYLANVDGKYTVIWGFDTDTEIYDLVFPSPPGSGVLTPGAGYWVWLTEDGMIIPTGY